MTLAQVLAELAKFALIAGVAVLALVVLGYLIVNQRR